MAGLLILTACFEIIDDKDPVDPFKKNQPPPFEYTYPDDFKANTITISGFSSFGDNVYIYGCIGLFQNEEQINPDFFSRAEIRGSDYVREGKINSNLYSGNTIWDGGGSYYVVFEMSIYDNVNYDNRILYYVSKSPVDFTSNKDQVMDFSDFKKYVYKTTAGYIAGLKSFNIPQSGITLDELFLDYNCMTYAQMLENERMTEIYKNEEKTQLFNGGDILYSDTIIYGDVDIIPLLSKIDNYFLGYITGTITLTDIPDNLSQVTIYVIEKVNRSITIYGELIQDPNNPSKYRWKSGVYYYNNLPASEYNFYLKVSIEDYNHNTEYTVPIQTVKYISNNNAYVGDLGTASLKSIVISGYVYAVVNNQPAFSDTSIIEIVVKTPQGTTSMVQANIIPYPIGYPEQFKTTPTWSCRMPVFTPPTKISFDVTVRDRKNYSQPFYTRENLLNPIVFISNEDVSEINLFVSDKFDPVNVTPLVANVWIHDSILNSAVVDWYSLEVTKGTKYYFWWNDKFGGDRSKTAGIYVYVYSSGAKNSSEAERYLYRSDSWNDSTVYTALTSGTVFIKVDAQVPSNTGTYALVYSTNDSKPAGGNTTYSVSFNSNGGSGAVSPISVLSETEITLPLSGTDSVYKDGYALTGWNTLANGTGTNYIPGASYKVTGNVTLYAKWNPVYTITFDGNAGVGKVPSSLLATVGTNYVVPLPYGTELSKDGYTFGGWNTLLNGTGTNYNAGANYTANGNVTLYAKWNPIYTVTFNINGGVGTIPAIQAKKDTEYVITLPTGSGISNGVNAFGGWNTQASGTGSNYFTSYTASGNVTLYAKWNPPGSEGNPIPLTADTWTDGDYNSNVQEIWYSFNITTGTTYYIWWNDKDQGDNTKTSNIDVSGYLNGLNGSSTAIPSFPYTDSAWNSPKTYVAGSDGIVKLKVRPYNTGTFAICYSTNNSKPAKAGNTYTVAFNGNGNGVEGTVSTITAVSGSSVTLPSGGGFARYAYSFAGWNTNSDGSGTSYSVGDSFTVNGFVTLYAKWNLIPLGREGNPVPLIENLWKNDVINSTTVDREIWYCFDAENGKTYYLWWNDSAEGDNTKTLDVKVEIYNTNGSLAFSADNGWNQALSITANSKGKIKIKVSPKTAGNTGTFALIYSTKSGKPKHTLLTADKWEYGYLPESGDEQWFKFTATAAAQYIHFIFGALSSANVTSVNVQLYDDDYNMVGSKSNLSGNDKIFSLYSLINGQEYFIKVKKPSNSDGAYKIAFNKSTEAPYGNVPPYYSNTPTLLYNFWKSDNITVSNDERWFKFTAAAETQSVHFKPIGIGSAFVQLYDYNGNAIGNWEHITGNRSFSRSLNKDREYYVHVMPTKILIPSNPDKGSFDITFSNFAGFPSIAELSLNVLTDYNFATPESEIWLKFTAKAASHYFPIRNYNNNTPLNTPLSKINCRLYNEAGAPLENTFSISIGEKTGTRESSLTVGNVYYLKVSPSSGSTGSRFSVTYNASQDAVIRPSYMPGIYFNQWSQGEIKGDPKEQWFSYTPSSTELFTFHFLTTWGLFVYIYDESGDTVYHFPEIITAITPSFPYILTKGNTYYIRITPSVLSNAGKFSICVNDFVLAPLPPQQ